MERMTLEAHIANGKTIRQIAAVEGTSFTNVRYWLKKHGLKTGVVRSRACDKGRRCGHCGETDPSKFYGRKRFVCARCHNDDCMERGRATRARILEHFGGKCADCGFHACLPALQVHHLDPSQKDVGFGHWRGWSWERIEAELKGCVLVCANCHIARHIAISGSFHPAKESHSAR